MAQTKEYAHQYYVKNRERLLKQSSEYRKRNSEKYKKYLADYYIKHKDKLKGDARRTYWARPYILRWAQRTVYNHRQDGNIVNITPHELVEIAMQHKTCEICGCELVFYNGSKGKGQRSLNSVSLDRKYNENVIDKDNILILCIECNRLKGARTVKEFYDYCKMVVDSEFFKNEQM